MPEIHVHETVGFETDGETKTGVVVAVFENGDLRVKHDSGKQLVEKGDYARPTENHD